MAGKHVTLTWKSNPDIYAPARHRKACKYKAFIPDPLTSTSLRLDAESMGLVSEAEGAIRSLNDMARSGLGPLGRLLLRTESIASSKVEGMQLDVRELARAEARRDSGGKTSSLALEILSNIDAMELAVEDAATVKRFSVNEIEAVHRLLMGNAPNAHIAGHIRTQQNWIGGNDHNPCGADYVPPPPEHVAPLLEDLCKAVNGDVLPPLIQAALVHAQFETIHPFDDGNGRTGRALIQIVLRRRGIASSYVPPVSVMLARSKSKYIGGLTQFREKDGATRWVRQFAESAASAATLAGTYLEAVQKLVAKWHGMLESSANPRSDSVAWKLIDILPAHPMITAPVAASVTGGSRPSVQRAIQELQDAGILTPLSQGKRNQSWEAVGLLELLGQLEAGQSLTLRAR